MLLDHLAFFGLWRSHYIVLQGWGYWKKFVFVSARTEKFVLVSTRTGRFGRFVSSRTGEFLPPLVRSLGFWCPKGDGVLLGTGLPVSANLSSALRKSISFCFISPDDSVVSVRLMGEEALYGGSLSTISIVLGS